MSRSTKKTPKIGVTTADTEKECKRIANRKFRRTSKNKVELGKEILPEKIREVSNVWAFDKDGKHFIENPTKKMMRK